MARLPTVGSDNGSWGDVLNEFLTAGHTAGGVNIVTRMIVFATENSLSIQTGPIRIYNKLGATYTISKVFIAANTAPVGAAIIVDVNKNGTTLFTTQSNRPQIAAAANTGETTTIQNASFADGDYLTMDIDQVGSSTAGSNLTVHIIFS